MSSGCVSDSDDKLETLIFFGVLALTGVFAMGKSFKAWADRVIGNVEASIARNPGRAAVIAGVASFLIIAWIVA